MIYVKSDGFDKPPKLFSTLEKAETEVLSQVRELNHCGFSSTIHEIAPDINSSRAFLYHGSVYVAGPLKLIELWKSMGSYDKSGAPWLREMITLWFYTSEEELIRKQFRNIFSYGTLYFNDKDVFLRLFPSYEGTLIEYQSSILKMFPFNYSVFVNKS